MDHFSPNVCRHILPKMVLKTRNNNRIIRRMTPTTTTLRHVRLTTKSNACAVWIGSVSRRWHAHGRKRACTRCVYAHRRWSRAEGASTATAASRNTRARPTGPRSRPTLVRINSSKIQITPFHIQITYLPPSDSNPNHLIQISRIRIQNHPS